MVHRVVQLYSEVQYTVQTVMRWPERFGDPGRVLQCVRSVGGVVGEWSSWCSLSTENYRGQKWKGYTYGIRFRWSSSSNHFWQRINLYPCKVIYQFANWITKTIISKNGSTKHTASRTIIRFYWRKCTWVFLLVNSVHISFLWLPSTHNFSLTCYSHEKTQIRDFEQ